MKHATKAEVVQVAENLLEPLLEGIHQDMANLRAEVVAEGKARVAQDTKLVAATTEVRHRATDLEGKLQRFERAVNAMGRAVDELKQTKAMISESLTEIQRTQAAQKASIGRIDRMLKRLLEAEAKRAGNEISRSNSAEMITNLQRDHSENRALIDELSKIVERIIQAEERRAERGAL